MPEATIASAVARISFSSILQAKWFQLFQPMGGVSARCSNFRALTGPLNMQITSNRILYTAMLRFRITDTDPILSGIRREVRGKARVQIPSRTDKTKPAPGGAGNTVRNSGNN